MPQKFIEELLTSHNHLLDIINRLPDQGKILGDWEKKEIVDHISGWYEEGVDSTPKILKGEIPNSFRKTINGYNDQSVKSRKKQTLKESLSEMKKSHAKFVSIIKTLTDAEIVGYYGTTLRNKPINVLWVINMCIHHDEKHAKQLVKKVK